MIKSFRSKRLQVFFEGGDGRKLSVQDHTRIARLLRTLEAASKPDEMNLPGYKFHNLRGDQKGRFSVWVSRNYQLTFGWEATDAVEVDLEDYH